MNKLFVSLVLALSVSASSLVAVESSPKALNKADSALLFGVNAQNVDVIALSEEEMQNTKGEGVLLTAFALAAAKSAGTVAGGGAVYWIGDKLGLW